SDEAKIVCASPGSTATAMKEPPSGPNGVQLPGPAQSGRAARSAPARMPPILGPRPLDLMVSMVQPGNPSGAGEGRGVLNRLEGHVLPIVVGLHGAGLQVGDGDRHVHV